MRTFQWKCMWKGKNLVLYDNNVKVFFVLLLFIDENEKDISEKDDKEQSKGMYPQ